MNQHKFEYEKPESPDPNFEEQPTLRLIEVAEVRGRMHRCPVGTCLCNSTQQMILRLNHALNARDVADILDAVLNDWPEGVWGTGHVAIKEARRKLFAERE